MTAGCRRRDRRTTRRLSVFGGEDTAATGIGVSPVPLPSHGSSTAANRVGGARRSTGGLILPGSTATVTTRSGPVGTTRERENSTPVSRHSHSYTRHNPCCPCRVTTEPGPTAGSSSVVRQASFSRDQSTYRAVRSTMSLASLACNAAGSSIVSGCPGPRDRAHAGRLAGNRDRYRSTAGFRACGSVQVSVCGQIRKRRRSRRRSRYRRFGKCQGPGLQAFLGECQQFATGIAVHREHWVEQLQGWANGPSQEKPDNPGSARSASQSSTKASTMS